jgi:uncharacterized protein (DUF2062 family)
MVVASGIEGLGLVWKERRRLPFGKPAGLWHRLGRAIRFRLIVPMMRSQHSPEHTARGVMIGLVCACIPSPVGQMGLAFAAWVIARRVFKWDFSLIQGLAWTWATNVFTAAPCYYAFFLTGQILLGRWDDLSGYDSFVQVFSTAMSGEAGFLESLYGLAKVVVLDWGLAMYIGAIPWAMLSGWLGYRLGLRFVIAYRAARARRWARRAAHYAELAAKRQNAAP